MNNKIKVNIFIPVHSTKIFVRYDTHEALVHTGQSNIQASWRSQAKMFRASATVDRLDVELPTKIAVLDNKITKGDYDIANEIPREMLES